MRFSQFLTKVSLVLFLAVVAVGCRSAKIPSQGSDKSMLSSKKELVAVLEKRATNGVDFNSYYAKNASVRAELSGASHSAKANLYFKKGEQTVVNVRIPFPPISVAKAYVDNSQAKVKSSILNLDNSLNVPPFFNTLLQNSICGIVPPFYELGTDYQVVITSDNLYQISMNVQGFKTDIFVNQDFSLNSVSANGSLGCFQIKIGNYSDFSGHSLPQSFSIDIVTTGKQSMKTSCDINIPDIVIDGKDSLSF